MCLQSFKVSEKLCTIKELMLTWLRKVWACISPTLVDKMQSNSTKRLKSDHFLVVGHMAAETKHVTVPKIKKEQPTQIQNT
jgi:hypothetical protein